MQACYDALYTYLVVYLEEASPSEEDRKRLVDIMQEIAWESDWTVTPPTSPSSSGTRPGPEILEGEPSRGRVGPRS